MRGCSVPRALPWNACPQWRGYVAPRWGTQGVALGWVCRAPSGLPSASICVHLRFVFPICSLLCLLCIFVANPLPIRVHPWFFPPMSRPLRAGFEGVFCPPGRCPGMLARNGGGMSRPFGAPLRHLRPSAVICGLFSHLFSLVWLIFRRLGLIRPISPISLIRRILISPLVLLVPLCG